ncbi:hypothetical protein ACQKD0_04895 [Vreelandella aquamarina]|uniref:hypothetical protein n=1 Tax=Vreelandella aquamarina TaxID=77097 RepID=UPI003D0771F0
MDASEAVEYVRKDVHDTAVAELEQAKAHIAALQDDIGIHRAAEEMQIALREKAEERVQAHVEQLNYAIVDAKRCAAALAFPSNYNAADYQSFAKDVMSNIEALSKQEPMNSLARRDAIKQAEALDDAAEGFESQNRHFIAAQSLRKSAAYLRQQAEAKQ